LINLAGYADCSGKKRFVAPSVVTRVVPMITPRIDFMFMDSIEVPEIFKQSLF
jgi:hypothetical protein